MSADSLEARGKDVCQLSLEAGGKDVCLPGDLLPLSSLPVMDILDLPIHNLYVQFQSIFSQILLQYILSRG